MHKSRTIAIAGLMIIGACSIDVATPASAAEKIVVVDGDTISVGGRHLRLIGFDTPETALPSDKPTRTPRAKCMAEYHLGQRAKVRLKQLVKSGKVTLERGLGTEHYGRELARLRVDGRDVGDILMSEGLAQPFNLRPPKPNWC